MMGEYFGMLLIIPRFWKARAMRDNVRGGIVGIQGDRKGYKVIEKRLRDGRETTYVWLFIIIGPSPRCE